MRERIINATIRALHEIRNRRFLATERGYQGAFYCMLHQLLTTEDLITENRILEMEYQKSTRHGLRKRPDIIFHIPAELTGAGVRENNFALWYLKYQGSAAQAREDFDDLDLLFAELEYPLGFFVNVNSSHHRLENYDGPYRDRIKAFAARLLDEAPRVIMGEFQDGCTTVEV